MTTLNERGMVRYRSTSPFGRRLGYHNELSLRPYDDLEFRAYPWDMDPWNSGSYSSCPGCSLCSSILAIVRLIYSL